MKLIMYRGELTYLKRFQRLEIWSYAAKDQIHWIVRKYIDPNVHLLSKIRMSIYAKLC